MSRNAEPHPDGDRPDGDRPTETQPAYPQPIYKVKAEFFKTLGHPARIRVLEVLRGGEHSVGELVEAVGLEQSHVSQQLAVLRRGGLVQTRREGTTVYYSVSDPRMFHLLETAKEMIATSLAGSNELLAELAEMRFEDPAAPSPPGA